ncbi:MAG TPA: YfiR family protein [Chitinophagaceae bacterium]|nr:YfiR family protein [Chitinophagaceae bacterium]
MFNRRRNKVCSFFILIIVLSFLDVQAQDDVNYAVHANIIYHFTKYIDWPPPAKNGDFTIGIVGETPVYDQLRKAVTGKRVGNQNITLKRFSSAEPSFGCQILFIGDDVAGSFKKIVSNTLNEPVLLVSESRGLARRGSCINFSIINDKLALEINQDNIQQRNLRIASELLQLGVRVK